MGLFLVLLTESKMTEAIITIPYYSSWPRLGHTLTQGKESACPVWLNGAVRSWPDEHFLWTKTLTLSQLSDGTFVLLIRDIDLFVSSCISSNSFSGCCSFSATLWTSFGGHTGWCTVVQADVNWDVLPLSVIITYCFPLKRSGCEAEKEEDVCLVSDSA